MHSYAASEESDSCIDDSSLNSNQNNTVYTHLLSYGSPEESVQTVYENKDDQDNSSHVTLQEQFNELQEMVNSGAISLNEYRVYHPLSNHFHELKMQLDKLLNSCPTVDNEVKNQIQASSIEFENNQKESKNSNRPKEEEKKKPRKMSIPYIIPMPPPESFDSLPLEEAIKYEYTIDDEGVGSWSNKKIYIRMCQNPFSRGTFRVAYHMMEYDENKEPYLVYNSNLIIESNQKHNECSTTSNDEQSATVIKNSSSPIDSPLLQQDNTVPINEKKQNITYVGKIDYNNTLDTDIIFKNVEMQIICERYAELYNNCNPPLPIHFNPVWIIKLANKPEFPYISVEPYLYGRYIKYNNNYGYVNESDEKRNTPQAFSHFTFEASRHTLIIVDIQGVGDLFTDPQIHSIDTTLFGNGNYGIYGIDRFLRTHRCNPLCQYLKLLPVNPIEEDQGTLPSTKYMISDDIDHFLVKQTDYKNIFDKESKSDNDNMTSTLHHSTTCFSCCSLM